MAVLEVDMIEQFFCGTMISSSDGQVEMEWDWVQNSEQKWEWEQEQCLEQEWDLEWESGRDLERGGLESWMGLE